jgi:hypothetical protein
MYNTMKIMVLVILSSLLISACSSVSIDTYRDQQPRLNVEEFFNGSLTAHGIVKNRSGEVIRHFNAELEGSWSDGKGLLKERFVFNDGEVQFRNWTLTPEKTPQKQHGKQTSTYIGRAEDVLGDGDVTVSGNAMFIRYTLTIPYGDSTIDIDVDDRMYLVSDKVLINESALTKWGFGVGEIVLTIIKEPLIKQ